MKEKAPVFSFPQASPMQGIKGAVSDSGTLCFLWEVNVPGFTGIHT